MHNTVKLACNVDNSLYCGFDLGLGVKKEMRAEMCAINRVVLEKYDSPWFDEINILAKTFKKFKELTQEEQHRFLKNYLCKEKFKYERDYPHSKFGVQGNLRGKSLRMACAYLHDPNIQHLLEDARLHCARLKRFAECDERSRLLDGPQIGYSASSTIKKSSHKKGVCQIS